MIEAKKQAGKKFGEGEMKFSRPTFRNKKAGQFGNKGDFEDGLDELDEDGKKDSKKNDGQRDFVNLGSSAKAGHDKEEQKERKEGVKPTFKGKLNLSKTGGQPDEQNQGVVKDYDFRNVYKQPRTDKPEDGNERPKREGDENRRGGRGGGFRKNTNRGQDFKSNQQEAEDEGFTVVTNKPKKKFDRNRDDSSSDDNAPN